MLASMGRQPTIERTDVVALAFRLAATVRREFATRMVSEQWARDANLRRGCFGVLRVLERDDGPISQREVAERTGIDASDVVDLVDRLEQAGYVRRERDERDRRRYALELTPEGRDAIERFARVAREVDEAVLSVLDPEERDTLRSLIARIIG
jgi:MarR family transcriptional regulator, lower aerobic nicotinate degradation pathway regulator